MLPKGVTEKDLENPGERFKSDNEFDTSSYEVRGRGSVRELGFPLLRIRRNGCRVWGAHG